MAKYKVTVGGFVSVFRKRCLTVYASSESEAQEKAVDKFMEIQQSGGCSMCSEGTVESIEEVREP